MKKPYTGIPLWACLILLIVFMLTLNVVAAPVVIPKNHGGGITSLTIKTYVKNVGNYVLVDSSVITVFPNDTSITLDDSANWKIERGWLWDGETDTIWADQYWTVDVDLSELLANQLLIIDSLNAMLDSIQNQSIWGAKEASLFDGDLSSLGLLSNQVLLLDSLFAIKDSIDIKIDLILSTRSSFDNTTDIVVPSDTVSTGDTLAVKKDSTIYQGGSSSLTPTLIYDYFFIQQPGVWSATGGSGTGANIVTIFAIDTSGIDDTIPYVNFALYTSAGSLLGRGQTGVTGSFNANLDNGDVQFVANIGAAYTFPDSTAAVLGVSAVDTIYIYGYNNTGATPSSGSFAAVEGYERNINGSILVGAVVTINRITGDASSSSNAFNISTLYIEDTTDVNGYWNTDLYIEGNYDQSNTGLYTFTMRFKNKIIWVFDTMRVTVSTTINMADSLGVR